MSTLPVEATLPRAARRVRGRNTSERLARSLPPGIIAALCLQAAGSLALIFVNGVSTSEVSVLLTGRLEASGAPFTLPFAGGLPQLYPIIGGAVESVFHLTGARVLSLLFMFVASLSLAAAAGRLFGRTAALIASLLWITSEPALRLGAIAIPDAMAISLICVSVALGVEATARARRLPLVITSGAVLGLAALIDFSYALYFLPVCAALFLVWLRVGARRASMLLGLFVLSSTAVFAPVLFGLGDGHLFAAGISGVPATQSTSSLLLSWWTEGGLSLLICLGGTMLFIGRARGRERWLSAVLVLCGLLVAIVQLTVEHGGASFEQHLAVAIWLAAIPGGAGLAELRLTGLSRTATVVMASLLLLLPCLAGFLGAFRIQHGSADDSRLAATIRRADNGLRGTAFVTASVQSVAQYATTPAFGRRPVQRWIPPPLKSGRRRRVLGFYSRCLSASGGGKQEPCGGHPPRLVALVFNVPSPSYGKVLLGDLRNPRVFLHRPYLLPSGNREARFALATALESDKRYRDPVILSFRPGVGPSSPYGLLLVWRRH